MTCELFKTYLDLYIDDTLPPAQTEELLAHADACSLCRDELNAAEELRDLLHSMGDEQEDLPEGAHEKIVKTARYGKKDPTKNYQASLIMGAAAVILVVTVTLFDSPDFSGSIVGSNGTANTNNATAPMMVGMDARALPGNVDDIMVPEENLLSEEQVSSHSVDTQSNILLIIYKSSDQDEQTIVDHLALCESESKGFYVIPLSVSEIQQLLGEQNLEWKISPNYQSGLPLLITIE